jgi:hypothetical protein
MLSAKRNQLFARTQFALKQLLSLSALYRGLLSVHHPLQPRRPRHRRVRPRRLQQLQRHGNRGKDGPLLQLRRGDKLDVPHRVGNVSISKAQIFKYSFG